MGDVEYRLDDAGEGAVVMAVRSFEKGPLMFRSRIVVLAIASLAVTYGGLTHAQTTRPDFSGTWEDDIEASRTLTLENGGEWRVSGAGTSAAGAAASGAAAVTPPADTTAMRRLTVITQTERDLVLETRYGEKVVRREVYKLDGTVSVNAQRNISSRSTTVWKGRSLVTTGTMHFDFSDGSARDASGKPISELTREFVTTRTLMPDGTMHVESWTREDGRERKQWLVLVRARP